MREIAILTGMELRSVYGINIFLHTRDKKAKNRYRLLCGAWVVVIGIVVFYVAGLVYGLCSLGLGAIVPAYLTVLASLLILAFGSFTAGHRIFRQKGYDLLASLPVKPRSIVFSRFLTMYLEDLVLTAVVLLPGFVTYGICRQPPVWFYGMGLLVLLLLPAIPLVLSVVLGTVVTALSSGMKHKSLMQSVLMVGLVVVILVSSMGAGQLAEGFDPEVMADMAAGLGARLEGLYPPAAWVNRAMAEGKLLPLAAFLLVSLAATGAMVWAVARNFHRILGRLNGFSSRQDYRLGALSSRSLTKALYLREVKRYFASSIYVTNTIIGPIMGAILCIALAVTGTEAIGSVLPPQVDAVRYLPFVVAGVFCMMTTTSVSISMEGKQIWIVKSLPIPVKAWLDSKILLSLTLALPFYLISCGALLIALRPGLLQLIWLVLLPLLMLLFSAVVGITVNLRLHRFDWDKEEAVVKQSASAALGGFAGPLVSMAMAMAVALAPEAYADWLMAALCLLLAGVTLLLYRRNNQAKLELL